MPTNQGFGHCNILPPIEKVDLEGIIEIRIVLTCLTMQERIRNLAILHFHQYKTSNESSLSIHGLAKYFFTSFLALIEAFVFRCDLNATILAF